MLRVQQKAPAAPAHRKTFIFYVRKIPIGITFHFYDTKLQKPAAYQTSGDINAGSLPLSLRLGSY